MEKDGFYDPYLKFCVHKTIANVAALNKSYKDSAELFYQAYLDIEPSGDEQYIIDALYNEASVLMVMNSYKECTNVLDKIVSYILSRTAMSMIRKFYLSFMRCVHL